MLFIVSFDFERNGRRARTQYAGGPDPFTAVPVNLEQVIECLRTLEEDFVGCQSVTVRIAQT